VKKSRLYYPKGKMPMVVFGSGMFGKDSIHFKGHRHGVVGKIYAHLKHRASLGELCLLNIDEYFTSQVSATTCIVSLHYIDLYF
jgi:hypothetical protein